MITDTQKAPQVGLSVLIFNPQGEVLLGKRKNAHGEGTWAPPGGKLHFGETLEEGILREADEEVGIDLSSNRLTLLTVTNDFFPDENKHFVSICFKTVLSKFTDPNLLEPEKCSEWGWFSLQNLPKPLFSPVRDILENFDDYSGYVSYRKFA